MILIHLRILFKILPCEAITLYPFVFYKNKPFDKVLENHERIHFEQIKKYGFFYFYFDYCFQYFKNRLSGKNHYDSYLEISYEKEAYSNQENLDYKVTK